MFSHFLRKLGSLGRGAGVRTIVLNGRKWWLAPNAMSVFGPAGPDLDRWIADGSAAIVKTGPHRTVYRVTLRGGVVYVKHCRIMGPRAWAREVLRPPKARLEFENLLALQERGISAAVPLAWASRDSMMPGESWLITRSLEGAVPFTEFVERGLKPAERRELAHELGLFFARLHDAGVAHPDPHPGNLLIESGRFSLIDLHAVGLSGSLSWSARSANLALFNRWFQLRATRTDRLRFWRAYCTEPDAQARALERLTSASNRRFWASRVSRCLGTNRYFLKLKRGPYRGFAVRDLPNDILTPFLADPDALFTGAKLLKDSRTSKVAIVRIGGRELLLKRVNIRNRIEPLKNRLRPSAVLRSWINGHSLRDRWLPTPRPLVMLHRDNHEAFLLTELVAAPLAVNLFTSPPALRGRGRTDAPSISTAGDGTARETPWKAPSPGVESAAHGFDSDLSPAEPGERCTALARMLRHMHDRGVSHRDLKASNILLERGVDPVLIDLVGVRLGSPPQFKQRAKELARLNASFLSDPAVRLGARLRFLLTYLNAGECRHANWKEWWREIAAATAVKQAKNRRTGRPLA